MEFLRFGSSIPGSYWGCCAVCIIQNFKVDPDTPASIQLVDGDGGMPLSEKDKFIFAGPTYKDIFLQRLRIGTFSKSDMPNHVFLAVLTEAQICGGVGAKWLKLLKEQGFEFIRTTDNSVYSGPELLKSHPGRSPHRNYLFGLFRNVGAGAVDNPFLPPAEWTALDKVVPEAWEKLSDTVELAVGQQDVHTKLFKKLPKNKWMTEDELEKTKTPITLAGRRSQYPQELKTNRETRERAAEGASGSTGQKAKPVAAPFG